MRNRWRDRLIPVLLGAVALAIWLPTIGWGLPSRASDRYLFGERTPWTGREILALLAQAPGKNALPLPLAGGGTGLRGADVDADPILDRSKPVVLNDTDAKRAAIVQRYRLMSGQPDEFIQFKALAEMSARSGLARLDPRLYQYGGLWIYPVGAFVRTAMFVGLIERPRAGVPALEFYLDHPEAFGRFYVVARAYSAIWGVVAMLAVYAIARRITANRALGAAAAIAFVLLPVVRTATHEAKPHLAGAALCLWAVLAAANYVETGRRRWLIAAGTLCGASMAMVVSMLLSVVVLPTMVWLRYRELRTKNPLPRTRGRGQGEGAATGVIEEPDDRRATAPSPQPSPSGTEERGLSSARSIAAAIVASLAIAFVVYAATNPFVLYNAVARPELLRSNLGNSTAMYRVGSPLHMVPNAYRLVEKGMTTFGARFALAAIATAAWLGCASPPGWSKRRCWILTTPSVAIAMQFIVLSVDKPAEYARFGILPFAASCVVAVAIIRSARVAWRRVAVPFAVSFALLLTIPSSWSGPFDPNGWPSAVDRAEMLNHRAAEHLDANHPYRLGMMYEPAPWSSPPVDLFKQQIVLVRPAIEMFDSLDAMVWPLNVQSQLLGGQTDRESIDWRDNRFGVRSEPRDGTSERWGNWH